MNKKSNAVENRPAAKPTLWERDDIQFPRLLTEILATQDTLDVTALAQSMDLSVDEIGALFDRAETAWEAIKTGPAAFKSPDPVEVLAGGADGKPASVEEAGGLSEARQNHDASAPNSDQPEVSDEDIALATAAGFRVHLGTAVDGAGLNLRYWWTLCQPRWSGCETSPGSFDTKKHAWQDAVKTLRDDSELGEPLSTVLNTKSDEDGKLRNTSFAAAYRSLVRKWKSESLTTRAQWPSIAKAILYRIESNSPNEALRLLKAEQEKVSGSGVSSYYQRAIDDVQILADLQQAESQSARVAQVACATVDSTPDLSDVDADLLLRELRRRGLVVSAWGLEDAATPLENDDETEGLTKDQFARLEEKLLEKASVSLEDLLTTRGNEHFANIWDTQRSRMLEEVRRCTNSQSSQ
ncbi:hypothetical protein E2P84_22330 [Burkholderia cepacia]|uniref:Uncharacterized protein n=1 Tax=Burkholderia cepacia TaxID=292 RepID=A0AAX2RJ95_BURCE|nr:hypothetical protein [Burkholderia cepacia]TES73099.1 hypothetical protein E2P84_22330 [Burkholderia cepacia]TES99214.1 hypothetical protein E3D36_26315 [Burkholderia cepacia]TEU40044.1 hypothetical protein E3D37_29280 [Burkholderia cepacia]TEU46882.1 hypothetical protein E3D38_24285 [Burkholderia cepacia]TEU93499.1 hypothetical protein E3D40_27850 [Burkholderia cepacia]